VFLAQILPFYYSECEKKGHGAVFFAVCRGKVSEGIDFSDARARAVIITGIPYPAMTDPRVILKRQYLDDLSKSNKTSFAPEEKSITGTEWYTQQASRAVNQAIGRVIRHLNDFGAIILCDERFNYSSSQSQMPVWVRPYVRSYSAFGEVQGMLTRFFRSMEPQVSFFFIFIFFFFLI
jgi:regulator of telomere elongation helicase 1